RLVTVISEEAKTRGLTLECTIGVAQVGARDELAFGARLDWQTARRRCIGERHSCARLRRKIKFVARSQSREINGGMYPKYSLRGHDRSSSLPCTQNQS